MVEYVVIIVAAASLTSVTGAPSETIWTPQLAGIIIGASIAGTFSAIGVAVTLYFQGKRLGVQLDHDREARERQSMHDRHQEIRGRRTNALGNLHQELEKQSDALTTVWAVYNTNNAQLRGDLKRSEPLGVLLRREYRGHLWPINIPVTRTINSFAERSAELQHKIQEGQIQNLEPLIKSTSEALSKTLSEVAILMSEINDIEVVERADV